MKFRHAFGASFDHNSISRSPAEVMSRTCKNNLLQVGLKYIRDTLQTGLSLRLMGRGILPPIMTKLPSFYMYCILNTISLQARPSDTPFYFSISSFSFNPDCREIYHLEFNICKYRFVRNKYNYNVLK